MRVGFALLLLAITGVSHAASHPARPLPPLPPKAPSAPSPKPKGAPQPPARPKVGPKVGTVARASTPPPHRTNEPIVHEPAADPGAGSRYAALDDTACIAELDRRSVGHERVAVAHGVRIPIRLTGSLHGVRVHSSLREKDRATSPYEIFDCRLVLALDDFASMLESHDIVELVHYSAYRPDASSGDEGDRHSGALAIDAARFVKRDGSVVDVEHEFHGRIGAVTCGEHAEGPRASSEAALLLRSLACEASARRLFHVVLTPNFNAPHRNHFHLEVRANTHWYIVH